MTTAARARRIQHRLVCARTWGDVLAVGDALGISRELPVPAYIRAVQRRYVALGAWTMTVPYARRRRGE